MSYLLSSWPNFIGLVGVGIILLTYFLLQTSYLKLEDLSYSLGNFIGALMVFYSLMYQWNTPSVVIEIVWLGISLYGMIKVLKRKKKAKR